MKYIFLFFSIVFSTPIFSQISKVLIIGIDGCRSDALEQATTPNLDALMNNGTFSYDALNDDITISGPGWSGMLCGVRSNKHGVTDNSFNGSNYGNYPHFIQHVENHNPSLHTASICHWNPINDNIVGNSADFKLNVNSDSDLAVQASNYLLNNDPDILFLHFDECDGVGHSTGFSTTNTAYMNKIETTDNLVGTVMNSLMSRPNYANENWLILSSTDHGGLGFSHGGTSLEEERIFFIASGDQIPNQQIFADSTLNPIAGNCLSATTELHFDGNDDYVEIPNSPIFNFGTNQDFTIECRVRTTQAADVAIIGNKDWTSGANTGFVFSFRFASGPEWKVNIGDGSNRADLNVGGSIADNGWHTLSVSFDRDGDMRMYEDGNFIAQTSIANVGNVDAGFPIRFGADAFGNFAYNGSIAEVRVWDSVLDAATIADWYCQPINFTHPKFSNLLGNWKMDEGAGATQVNDASLNSNHGVINGASWISSPQNTVTFDYTNTPRITDVAVSALAHLCIPIQSSWDLDGSPVFSSCPDYTMDCTEFQYTLPLIFQSNYHAINSVISTAIIDGVDVDFRGGNFIELQPGFETKNGVWFNAVIEPCN